MGKASARTVARNMERVTTVAWIEAVWDLGLYRRRRRRRQRSIILVTGPVEGWVARCSDEGTTRSSVSGLSSTMVSE
jgi:hypothetical protein